MEIAQNIKRNLVFDGKKSQKGYVFIRNETLWVSDLNRINLLELPLNFRSTCGYFGQ